jgi:hypothetical protein
MSCFLGEVEDPTKNSMAHNYMYADLPQILSIVRPLLAKYGLSVCQFPAIANEGKVRIETILMHESGDWISNEYEIDTMVQKGVNAAQSIGVIITYARRYALTSLLGICAQTDTDGNVVNQNKKLTQQDIDNLMKSCNNNKQKIEGIMKWANINNINELTLDQYIQAMEIIKKQNGA